MPIEKRITGDDYPEGGVDVEISAQEMLEELPEIEIEFDTATEIAEIFGFSLTEEVEMELTFKVQATFNVPVGFDHDKLAEDFGITENPLGVAEEYLENSHWELDDWNITS